jgi:hypothetical protein
MKQVVLVVLLVALVIRCDDNLHKETAKLTLPTQFHIDDSDTAPKYEIVIKEQFGDDILVRNIIYL